MIEISTFLGHIKCKKNISDVLKSLVTSPGLENAILNEFLQKFFRNVIFDEKSRFFDVFKELDPHTQGEKIFPYPFCIFSHLQKPNTAQQNLFLN